LTVSLVLHAALLAGLVAVSTGGATHATGGPDSRGSGEPSGWIVRIVGDEGETPPSPRVERPSAGPTFEGPARVSELPLRTDAAPVVAGPVVQIAASGAPGGGSAHGAKAGGGGAPRGNGDGTGSMFAAAPTAASVVYVLDRSGSMGHADAYRRACTAVLEDLARWPATTQFQVVPYNSTAEPLCVNASLGLLPKTTDTLQKVEALLAALRPTGWTNHRCGLQRALLLAPDVLYLVTDADDLTADDVRAITSLNRGRTAIHTIEMHSQYSARPTGALAQLAGSNKGTYRRVLLND
jgi:hypothetical protein